MRGKVDDAEAFCGALKARTEARCKRRRSKERHILRDDDDCDDCSLRTRKRDEDCKSTTIHVQQGVMQRADHGELTGIDIFAVGKWKDVEWTRSDLDEMVRNFEALGETVKPPAKLGHDDNQILAQQDGQPALGWVTRLYRNGDKLLADFADVPNALLEAIGHGRYRRVSAEIYPQFQDTPIAESLKSEVTGNVLAAVSFLGADIPEVKVLEDLPRVLHIDGAKVEQAPIPEGATAYITERVKARTRSKTIVRRETATGESSMSEQERMTEQERARMREEMKAEIREELTEDLRAEFKDELRTVLAEKDATIKQLSQDLGTMRERQQVAEATARRTAAEKYADDHMQPGNLRITQAMRPWVMLLHERLNGDILCNKDEAVARNLFSEKTEATDLSTRACFEQLIANLPDLSKITTEMSVKTDDAHDETFDGAVRIVAKEHNLNPDDSEDYVKAARLAYKDTRFADRLPKYGRAG